MHNDLLVNHARSISAPASRAHAQEDLTAWSAVIVDFSGHNLVRDDRITQCNARPPNDIPMVDDGSTDDSLAIMRLRHPDVQMLPMPAHTGCPAAVRNAALRNAAHPYVLLCDSDVHLASDAVQELVAVIRYRPDEARAGLTGNAGP